MSITRPSTLSQEEMDRLLDRIASHGAKLTMVDPRVTSVQTWILSTIGVSIVGLAGWGIKSINDLNQTMATMLVRYDYDIKRVERIENHLEAVDTRVVTLERKMR